MGQTFEVGWEAEVPGPPEEVWDAVTRHSDGWLWPITYEPRLGGAESGLTGIGGRVTAWEPGRRFTTTATDEVGTNQLDYTFAATAGGTAVTYVHRTAVPDDDDLALQHDACAQHTDLYRHSMAEYVAHFAGRDATYVAVDGGPASAAQGSTAVLLRALGLPDDVAVGDEVTLAVPGAAPIVGVVDYRTETFLGIRSESGLHRIYGRDRWGWPVSVAHHLFDVDADGAAVEVAWRAFLDGLFPGDVEIEETA
ncbi:SRPBCC domain-containing protein [Iamia sp. SCSIO 61187]|uniref:SRPBCC family protein n=1 Tax=Iamia sp. SCSIO 61187 TaxID=2722752 RepID=UPI001C624D08|nr:SRPBCC domain-containing protein [Iamia sp. SCSIO 61187]QYG91920.1 SRPBCC domain-containing protein [Iamia sp. SCSIO 61187]